MVITVLNIDERLTDEGAGSAAAVPLELGGEIKADGGHGHPEGDEEPGEGEAQEPELIS